MNNLDRLMKKLYSLEELKKQVQNWQKNGEQVVFTNGCFDLVHRGHIDVLMKTSDLGDRLIIGLNSDISVKKLKGKNRPIIDQKSRSILLAAFEFVDAVVLFDDETPLPLIETILPNILAKGNDYKIKDIVGYDIVIQNGGKVKTVPLTHGFSTTNIIDKISNKSDG